MVLHGSYMFPRAKASTRGPAWLLLIGEEGSGLARWLWERREALSTKSWAAEVASVSLCNVQQEGCAERVIWIIQLRCHLTFWGGASVLMCKYFCGGKSWPLISRLRPSWQCGAVPHSSPYHPMAQPWFLGVAGQRNSDCGLWTVGCGCEPASKIAYRHLSQPCLHCSKPLEGIKKWPSQLCTYQYREKGQVLPKCR